MEQPIRNEADLPRRRVKTQLVAPGAERFQNCSLPALQFDIRRRGKSRIEHAFEIHDAFHVPRLQPRRVRILPEIESLPNRLQPVRELVWKLESEFARLLKQPGIVEGNRRID